MHRFLSIRDPESAARFPAGRGRGRQLIHKEKESQ